MFRRIERLKIVLKQYDTNYSWFPCLFFASGIVFSPLLSRNPSITRSNQKLHTLSSPSSLVLSAYPTDWRARRTSRHAFTDTNASHDRRFGATRERGVGRYLQRSHVARA